MNLRKNEGAILNIENLTISNSRGKELVSHVNITVELGQVVALVGESGSGKSLSAASIIKLLPKTLINKIGKIYFCTDQQTVEINSLSEKELCRIRGKEIGFVFQEPMSSLNPVMKCGEQVREVFQIHKIATPKGQVDKVYDLFKEVGLNDTVRIYNSYPHQLSGGQKQRVMIAMAIAGEPKLLIADEPTTALDSTVQLKIIQLLDDLRRKRNMSILFVSHDLNLVKGFADKVYVMRSAKIVESGPTDELFNKPKDIYTKSLLSCRPSLSKKLTRLPELKDFENPESNSIFKDSIISDGDLNKKIAGYSALQPLLEVSQLNVQFPKKSAWFKKKAFNKVVSDVSFKIFPGEVLALVGESGSGKSTIGRAIVNLLDQKSGTIKFQNQRIDDLNPSDFRHFRKQIQLIFQDPFASLNPRMKIGEAIAEAMSVHKIYPTKAQTKTAVNRLLEDVGLNPSDFEKYPHQFSGGQRQRISIARSLAVNPQLLICDECVSALDVNVQAQILNLLIDLKEKFGLTMLFITHDLSVVRFIADRVVVLSEGKIVEFGSVPDVYSNPIQDFTKQLLAASL